MTGVLASLALALLAAMLLVSTAEASPSTVRLSEDPLDIFAVGNGSSSLSDSGIPYTDGTISADGTKVVFESEATNLDPRDADSTTDVFVHDLATGTTTLVSVDSAGVKGNSYSFQPSISDDGTKVAFYSSATNLDPDDFDSTYDVFVHDLDTGTTELVSVDSDGVKGNSQSYGPSINDDGTKVAFTSEATNLDPDDTSGYADIFVRDLDTGTTELASVNSDGVKGSGSSPMSSISGDGTKVAFQSTATNLHADDTNGKSDVFVRDTVAGTTEIASTPSIDSSTGGNGDSYDPAISAMGEQVAFHSESLSNVVDDRSDMS
jgi:hypothetical protein